MYSICIRILIYPGPWTVWENVLKKLQRGEYMNVVEWIDRHVDAAATRENSRLQRRKEKKTLWYRWEVVEVDGHVNGDSSMRWTVWPSSLCRPLQCGWLQVPSKYRLQRQSQIYTAAEANMKGKMKREAKKSTAKWKRRQKRMQKKRTDWSITRSTNINIQVRWEERRGEEKRGKNWD